MVLVLRCLEQEAGAGRVSARDSLDQHTSNSSYIAVLTLGRIVIGQLVLLSITQDLQVLPA